MSSVVPFTPPPKSLKRTYKGFNYTVTYIPATKKWFWEIIKVHETRYGEQADSQKAAIKAAEKMIDSIT